MARFVEIAESVEVPTGYRVFAAPTQLADTSGAYLPDKKHEEGVGWITRFMLAVDKSESREVEVALSCLAQPAIAPHST
jgi:hypothetical protein